MKSKHITNNFINYSHIFNIFNHKFLKHMLMEFIYLFIPEDSRDTSDRGFTLNTLKILLWVFISFLLTILLSRLR